MDNRRLAKILKTLKAWAARWRPTALAEVETEDRDPFRILIGCLLSLRTKDETTLPASRRLFALAATPKEMVKLPTKAIEKAIYPVGFYRTKARTIQAVSRTLLERYGGRVPDELEELLQLKGIGRKTANLVVTRAYGKPGICVDTHVHRIVNRWGYVKTRTPEETELALRRRLPRRYWLVFNHLLVAFGQNICKPISPLCRECPVHRDCPQVGVTRHR